MGLHRRSSGALRERIESRSNELALIRAFLGVAAAVSLAAAYFGTAGSDRVAVSAPPPFLYNLA